MSVVGQFSILKEEQKPEIVIKQEKSMEFEELNFTEQTEKRAPIYYLRKGQRSKCCVCGETNEKCKMTIASKSKKTLLKWSQMFGPNVLKICEKIKTNHYICSIHWDQLLDDWEGPLPEVLEKMKKENNGRFKVKEEVKETPVFILNGKKEKPRLNKSDRRLECRYCGAKRVKEYMINVPNNEEQLLKWAEILGQQFLENVQKHTKNQICWNHFEYPEKKVSSISTRIDADNFPIAGKRKNAEKTKNQFKHTCICRYCGISCLSKNMTRVPSNEELLLKWADILGQEFLDNVITHKISLICWSHFKYREKSRTVYNLPVADIIMNGELTDKQVKVEEMESEQKPDVEMLIHEIKTEEKSNESVLASDYACSTANLPDDDNKLLIIPKDE